MTVTVYGSSDDLIEVEGDLTGEFYTLQRIGDDGNGSLLAFSDGTVLRIAYGDGGVWRITPVQVRNGDVEIVQCPEGDEDNYSDRATLLGDIKWVVIGALIIQ